MPSQPRGSRYGIRRWLPLLVAGALALSQVSALALQFARGFRPFGSPPSRVLFSWDMFAVPVERCDVRWSKPIRRRGAKLLRYRDLSLPFEWRPMHNSIAHWSAFAQSSCLYSPSGQEVELRCFHSDGRTTDHHHRCGE